MEYVVFYDVEFVDGTHNSYVSQIYDERLNTEQVKTSILNSILSLMMAEGIRIPYMIGKTGVIDLTQVKMISVDVRSAVK